MTQLKKVVLFTDTDGRAKFREEAAHVFVTNGFL